LVKNIQILQKKKLEIQEKDLNHGTGAKKEFKGAGVKV